MKTKLIKFPDYSVIVSDEDIEEMDLVYNKSNNKVFIQNSDKNDAYTLSFYQKLIASENPEHNLPSIDYNGFEEGFGIVPEESIIDICEENVNKYIKNIYKGKEGNPRDTRNRRIVENKFRNSCNKGVLIGFKKAQSLNDKKFSLKDMEKAYFNNEAPHDNFDFNLFIKSLQQPKIFDVEIKMEQINNKHNSPSYSVETKYKPKITNDKIKIINVL